MVAKTSLLRLSVSPGICSKYKSTHLSALISCCRRELIRGNRWCCAGMEWLCRHCCLCWDQTLKQPYEETSVVPQHWFPLGINFIVFNCQCFCWWHYWMSFCLCLLFYVWNQWRWPSWTSGTRGPVSLITGQPIIKWKIIFNSGHPVNVLKQVLPQKCLFSLVLILRVFFFHDQEIWSLL